ncbi:MAG: ABC transporter ATP-binding protein [Actinobacteria bacterium]|nr:ABC transporter ATP-binding protein [Actinomycetota bacterium]
MSGASISVQGLAHRYGRAAAALTVLDRLDIEVDGGGYVAITGASGAGKSTLLSVLGGLDAPQRGTVVIDENDLHDLSRNGLADYRRDTVGFVFQHFGLLDTLTAAENIELACSLDGMRPRARRSRARELLEAVGLLERRDHRPTALSGGERQRVAIARALANRPRLVLADEPTGNLDDGSTERVIELLESLPADHACTLVLVTHDRRLAARAQQRYELRGGRLHPSTKVTTEHATAIGDPEEPDAVA